MHVIRKNSRQEISLTFEVKKNRILRKNTVLGHRQLLDVRTPTTDSVDASFFFVQYRFAYSELIIGNKSSSSILRKDR